MLFVALSISVRGESPGQLGAGLGRTGGWGYACRRVLVRSSGGFNDLFT